MTVLHASGKELLCANPEILNEVNDLSEADSTV